MSKILLKRHFSFYFWQNIDRIIKEGVPPVTVRLQHEQHGGEREELGEGEVEVEMHPTLRDTGSGEDREIAELII